MQQRQTRFYLCLVMLCVLLTRRSDASEVQQVQLDIKKPEVIAKTPFVDLSAEYTARTDFNQKESPREYGHIFELTVSKSFFEHYTAFLTGGVQYSTLGNSVYRTTPQEDYFQPEDATLGGMRTFKIDDANAVTVMLTEDILLSDESRYFGYRSVTGSKGVFKTRLNKWVNLNNIVGVNYIWNRFRYASAASQNTKYGDINPDGVFDYSIGPMFRLLSGLRLGASLAVRGTHYLDGTSLYGFGNSYSLTYSYEKLSLYIRYINRGYSDRGETNLWFADQYRRLALAGLVYDF